MAVTFCQIAKKCQVEAPFEKEQDALLGAEAGEHSLTGIVGAFGFAKMPAWAAYERVAKAPASDRPHAIMVGFLALMAELATY